MSSWYNYDKFLKPYHLRAEGRSQLVTVARVGEKQVHDPNSNRDDVRPTLKFVEYHWELVINEGNRKAMIMLFGDNPDAYARKTLLIKVRKDRADEDGTIVILGEWPEGPNWRQVTRNAKGQPVKVEVFAKPKRETQPAQQLDEAA